MGKRGVREARPLLGLPSPAGLQYYLVNEFFISFFDLQAHGSPWKFLEYILQTNHVPV